MACCLMVRAALEHLIRTWLNQEDETVPNMKNRPTNTPTARWIFYCFIGIQTLNIDQKILIINLKPMHETIYKVPRHLLSENLCLKTSAECQVYLYNSFISLMLFNYSIQSQ